MAAGEFAKAGTAMVAAVASSAVLEGGVTSLTAKGVDAYPQLSGRIETTAISTPAIAMWTSSDAAAAGPSAVPPCRPCGAINLPECATTGGGRLRRSWA